MTAIHLPLMTRASSVIRRFTVFGGHNHDTATVSDEVEVVSAK